MTDPRISARRVEVRRAAGRRRLHRLLVLLGIAALFTGAAVLMTSPWLSARAVSVVGAGPADRAVVLSASGLVGEPLIEIDPGVAERAIDRLAWVESSTVTRSFPDGVTIVLRQRHAVAELVASNGATALVDQTGRVLSDGEAQPGSLPTISIDAALPRPGGWLPSSERPLAAAAAACPVSLLAMRPELLEGPLGVELHLSSGVRVLLGGANAFDAKLDTLSDVLAEANLHGIVTIDLEVPGAAVLTPRGATPIVGGPHPATPAG
jgi:cell division protein FtsQ